MAVSHRSCRICEYTPAEVELFDQNHTISPSGCLYESVLDIRLLPVKTERISDGICNSCYLQIKLFKDLKERALKALQKFDTEANEESKNETTEATTQTTEETEALEVLTPVKDVEYNTRNCRDDMLELLENNALNEEESLHISVDSEFIENQDGSHSAEDMGTVEYDSDYDDAFGVSELESIITEKSNSEDIDHNSRNYIALQYFEQKSDNEDSQDIEVTLEKQDIQNRKSKSSFKCSDCGIAFPTLRLLRTHRQQNHPLIHRCTECSKALRSAEALEVHMKLHLGLPAYTCEQCNKTFKQKVHYQYHIKRHNNERNFTCKECGKGYVSKSDLTTHMRQHIGKRPYTCPVEHCGKKCYTEQHLKMHMYHHDEANNFECDICHQKFVSPTVLHTHRQTIHAERRFECLLCGKKFSRKNHLEVHAITHENTLCNDTLPFENTDNCLSDNDIIDMDMGDEADITDELCYENLIEVDGAFNGEYNDSNDEFIKDVIESCDQNDSEKDISCYNIYSI